MKQYMAYFDFTTVHNHGKFVGRSGQCGFETNNDMLQVLKDVDEIQSLCAGFVLQQKPKWKILTITVTDIKLLPTDKEVSNTTK
jgi:hypothetical protein